MRVRVVVAVLAIMPLVPLSVLGGQVGEEVTITLLERDTSAGREAPGELPLLREIPPTDPRHEQARHLAENEAARFALRLVAAAWRVAGRTGPPPPLPILITRGGNNAAVGYRTRGANGIETRGDVPYIALDLQPSRFRLTLLHEAGHVAHDIVRDARRARPAWTAVPHSTFAVTDPLTALSEGYAIQLETLWGHFGADSAQRDFYTRASPDFAAAGSSAPFYFPANDLLNFSQTWARYSGVRDGDAAFAGHAYAGDILRTQYDPARDRATLKRPNAMIASEGVVASALFWATAGWAADGGAKPAAGLAQPAILRASLILLRALRSARGDADVFRPDVIDVVAAVGAAGSPERRRAVARLLDATRGVSARPALRETWRSFYHAASALDLERTSAALRITEPARAELLREADAASETLRRGMGPVLPVRVEGVRLQLVAFGDPFPLEFDLNAVSDAELAAMPRLDSAARARIAAELDRRPFASLAEFERRAGVSLGDAGLTRVVAPARPGVRQ